MLGRATFGELTFPRFPELRSFVQLIPYRMRQVMLQDKTEAADRKPGLSTIDAIWSKSFFISGPK